MMISNKAYDILKWVALIALDAVGVCYKTLATIWNWPLGDEVLNTCAAISLFIGSLIGISTAQYNRSVAIDNKNCYTQMVKENNELRETISLDNTFEVFNHEEDE